MKQRKKMKRGIEYNRKIRNSIWGFGQIDQIPHMKDFLSISGVHQAYLQGERSSATSIEIKSKEEHHNG
jgi:hypothetical protein